jgi:hypothetical protein
MDARFDLGGGGSGVGADLGELSALSLLDERFLTESGLLDETESPLCHHNAGAASWPELDAAFAGAGTGGGAAAMDCADAAAPALFVGAGTVQLRCIDAEHPPDCARCTPAPLDASAVELVGECGRKNGEKKLRALVTRTPEWNLLSERRKVVPLAVAAGMHGLPAALEEKKTSALRKARTRAHDAHVGVTPALANVCVPHLRAPHAANRSQAHLIFLARTWNYRSDTWIPRHDRAAGRALAELQRRATQQVVAAATPLPRFGEAAGACWGGVWSEGVLAPEAAWLFTQRTLRPLSLQIAGAFAGDKARLAATSQGGAEHITLAAAGEVRTVAGMAPGLLSQLGALHALLTAAQRALPADVKSAPARSCLSSPAYAGADTLLRLSLDSALANMTQAARASSTRLAHGELTSSERCWIAEMASSHDATLELLSHIARVLSAFRAASMDAFLEVAGSMLELLMVLVTSLGNAAASREAWMRELIAARGDAGGCEERSRLLVCWPVAPGELSDSPTGSDRTGSGSGGLSWARMRESPS